jgi:predicted RNase H-like HicB family nuclease
MKMNKELWAKAQDLARQTYDVEFEKDTFSDGTIVYLALNPELPGCMAQGATQVEAEYNLSEARADYIYALLTEGLEIPEPTARQTVTAQTLTPLLEEQLSTKILNFVYEPSEPDFESIVEDIIEPKDREKAQSIGLRGDLIKYA